MSEHTVTLSADDMALVREILAGHERDLRLASAVTSVKTRAVLHDLNAQRTARLLKRLEFAHSAVLTDASSDEGETA